MPMDKEYTEDFKQFLNDDNVLGEIIKNPTTVAKAYAKSIGITQEELESFTTLKSIKDALLQKGRNLSGTIFGENPFKWRLDDFKTSISSDGYKKIIAARYLMKVNYNANESIAMFSSKKYPELSPSDGHVHFKYINENPYSVKASELKLKKPNKQNEENEENKIIEVEVDLEQLLNNDIIAERITHRNIDHFIDALSEIIEYKAFSNFIVTFENYLRFLNNENTIEQNEHYNMIEVTEDDEEVKDDDNEVTDDDNEVKD